MHKENAYARQNNDTQDSKPRCLQGSSTDSWSKSATTRDSSKKSGVISVKSWIFAIYKRVVWKPEKTIAFTQHLSDFLKINWENKLLTLCSEVSGGTSRIVSITKQLLWIQEMTICYTEFVEMGTFINLTRGNNNDAVIHSTFQDIKI